MDLAGHLSYNELQKHNPEVCVNSVLLLALRGSMSSVPIPITSPGSSQSEFSWFYPLITGSYYADTHVLVLYYRSDPQHPLKSVASEPFQRPFLTNDTRIILGTETA